MATKDIRQRITIDTGTSVAEIRKVEDAAKATDRAVDAIDDREIDFDASQGLRDLDRIEDEIKKLNAQKVDIKADLDARGFNAGVDKLKTDQPGKRVGEQFVQDIGGAFGGTAFSQASADMVAAFETLGETLGDTGAGAIVNNLAGKIIPALAIGGAIAGAIGGLWQLFKDKGNEAADEVAKSMADALSGLDEAAEPQKIFEEAALELFKKLSPAARGALTARGLGVDELFDAVQGKAVPALEELRRARERVAAFGPLEDPNTVEQLRLAGGYTREQAETLVNSAKDYEKIIGFVHDLSGAWADALRDAQAYIDFVGGRVGEGLPPRATTSNVTNVTVNPPPGVSPRQVDSSYEDWWKSNGSANTSGRG